MKEPGFDFDIIHKSGKSNTAADALSRTEIPDLDNNEINLESELESDYEDDIYNRSTKQIEIHMITQSNGMSDENSESDDEDTNRLDNTPRVKIIPDLDKDKIDIIEEFHDNKLMGHRGIRGTLKRIQDQGVTWKGMRKDIRKYIKKCQKCKENKVIINRKVPMTITDTPERPIQKIALDVVGPLPETEGGNKYLLTCQCLLTKWVAITPMKTQDADATACALVENILLVGIGFPEVILTDQGPNFTSKLFRKTCKLLGIEKIQTTTYRPQSNGSLERSHRQLGEYLKHFIDVDRTNWDKLASYAAFCHNTTRHSATGYTPFELLFGRKANIPNSLTKPPQLDYNEDSQVTNIKENIRKLNDVARKNLIDAKFRSKIQYDKKSENKRYKLNDEVFIDNDSVRTNRKLHKRRYGPFKIIGVNHPNYQIKRNVKGLTKDPWLHIDKLYLDKD
jgi:hypothetical protein